MNKIKNDMYRTLKIDLFLKQLQLLSQTKKITPKQIYVQLTNLDIPESEKNQDLSDVFINLQEANKNNDKMKVFVSPDWNFFCQFISKNANKIYGINPIKIYVPLKRQNMEKSIQKIFDFINNNNIDHCSKLARMLRVDDLVIRVSNQQDADKIINFINNDPELTNNMYNPNPFCITNGKVGLAMDRILSYNVTLATYMYDYINEMNEQNFIVSCDGFKFFLQERLRGLQAKENLAPQIKMCEAKNLKRLPQFLQTLEEITNIIIKSIDGETKESLYDYFEQVNKEEYNEKKDNEYREFDYTEIYNNYYGLFKEVFFVISQKYGYYNAKIALLTYRNTGDENYITRTNNIREKVVASKTFRTFLNLIDLEKEMEELIPKVEEREEKPSKERILEEVCKSTYIACQTPERNFCGKLQVARSLIKIQSNDYNSITRMNNARNMAMENIRPEEVKNLLKRSLETNGYIIENEDDLYELYATHIEYLCNTEAVERGRNNAKK